ncbi:MAG TPA: cell shape determination protein CcmA, partial [Flavobacteriaceae bacterium]|nr:cell shape determination protein CcmA [Flavobacteriaceae bacterium]
MFSDKKDKQSMEPSASQNRINEGTELKGDIVSSGFFRIDGKVEGSISKPSKVVIGKTGTV